MLIRYYGHVGVPSGYGDAAAEMCMAILTAGLELEISTSGDQCHKRYLPLASSFKNEADLRDPDVVVVHTLPLDCIRVLEENRIRERYPKATCVAYTTWEGASFLPWHVLHTLRAFDQVWVPSQLTLENMWSEAGLPRLTVVPHPFDEERWSDVREPVSESRSTVPPPPEVRGVYSFYYVGAWNSRKNVDGVVRAYLRAFDRRDRVVLRIQSAQASSSACELAAMASGIALADMPPIAFSNQRISHEMLTQLHETSHCFVTSARGESWNIPAFDALLARNHIIAPLGLGSDEFLRETSAALYDSRLSPALGDVRLRESDDAPPGHLVAQYVATQGLTVKSDWLDPDLTALSIKMRSAYVQRITHLRVDYDPRVRFGRRAVGRRICELLQGAP